MLLWLDTDGKRRPWIAAITGRDRTYGLARDFLPPVDKKEGQNCYLLEEGILYQIQPVQGEREFLRIDADGDAITLETEDAMAIVQELEADRIAKEAKTNAAIDAGLERLNFTTEGGIAPPSEN